MIVAEAEKKLAECKGKIGIDILLKKHREIYELKGEVEVELMGVWDIVNHDTQEIMMSNIVGTKEMITRLAQEAFGFNLGELSSRWDVVPAKVKITSLIDAKTFLDDMGIPKEPIYEED